MVRIRTTNNRRRSKERRRASASRFFTLKLTGIQVFAMSKRGAVSSAADRRLERDGWGAPHDRDGVMETAYNYSDLTLPNYLVGVNQELSLISGYSFDPNAIDIRSGLTDTLRQIKARITAVTK